MYFCSVFFSPSWLLFFVLNFFPIIRLSVNTSSVIRKHSCFPQIALQNPITDCIGKCHINSCNKSAWHNTGWRLQNQLKCRIRMIYLVTFFLSMSGCYSSVFHAPNKKHEGASNYFSKRKLKKCKDRYLL